jgi:hypothetical protein
MNPEEKERLLQDVFDESELAEFRRQTVAHSLSRLRARRLRKRLAGAGAILCVGAAMMFLVSHHQAATPPAPMLAAVSQSTARQRPPAVQYVNDEQLLALFPHRPVALIGAAPHQRLIFLDEQPATTGP